MIAITLDDREITRAIKNHISSIGLDISNKEIDVAFTAGRGANGNTATVSLKDVDTKDCACNGTCNSTEEKAPMQVENTTVVDMKSDPDPAEEAVMDEEETEDKAETPSIFSKPE